MPLSSRKIPLFVGLPRYFPIGPMHRHPREITAISVFDSRVEAVSMGRLPVPEKSQIPIDLTTGKADVPLWR